MAGEIRLKRVYEPANEDDGVRVLVDRLWPRGVSKERASVDLWLKEAAPSDALRRWFHHQPELWEEFRRRYLAELAAEPPGLEDLRRLAASGVLTLVYSARDPERNQAVVLAGWLRGAR